MSITRRRSVKSRSVPTSSAPSSGYNPRHLPRKSRLACALCQLACSRCLRPLQYPIATIRVGIPQRSVNRDVQCPRWVKLRRTQYEHMFSALPSNSDIARRSRHVSNVPRRRRPTALGRTISQPAVQRAWRQDDRRQGREVAPVLPLVSPILLRSTSRMESRRAEMSSQWRTPPCSRWQLRPRPLRRGWQVVEVGRASRPVASSIQLRGRATLSPRSSISPGSRPRSIP